MVSTWVLYFTHHTTDVAVINHVPVTVNRYVEEVGLSPSIQSVSRVTVYRERKLKPGAASSPVYHLMQISKIPHSLLCSSTGSTCDQPCLGNRQQRVETGFSPSKTLVWFTHKAMWYLQCPSGKCSKPQNMFDLKTQPNNCFGAGSEEITST